jgi:ABC-type amino acid transport substrate-binding protein
MSAMFHPRAVATLAMLLIALPTGLAVSADALTRVHYQEREATNDTRFDYFNRLLARALAVTESSHGPFALEELDTSMNTARMIANMKNGRVPDVLWMTATRERQNSLHAVPVPLLEGALGARVLIVRREALARFDRIRRVGDFEGLVGVQGAAWSDTRILRHNGLKVYGIVEYERMFELVAAGRADYFPRGITEAEAELAARPQRDTLTIHPDLVLRYPQPLYFYTASHRPALAERLTQGLRQLRASGELDEIRGDFPETRNLDDALDLSDKRVLDLENPLIPGPQAAADR